MFNRFKIVAAYAFAIPLALVLGFLASSPDQMTFMLIAILLFCLSLPLIIKWHHSLMIVFWNSAFNAFFLPGQLDLWIVFAMMSFGISVLNHVMGRRSVLRVPEMIYPILFLTAVVLVTACYRGGIGIKAFGGAAHGGKYYVYILGAIVGYFALILKEIPFQKSVRMASLFFLSGVSFVLGNVAYTLGPAFYFLFYFVSSGGALGQVASDYGLTSMDRIQGLGQACTACFCFLLMFYGIRGLFDWAKPWRLILLAVVIGASFFAGFRSVLALLCLIFAFQFYFEKLFRTRFMLLAAGLAICSVISVFLFAGKLPLAVQRAVSFLPINVDSSVSADAAASTEWRMQMWSVVWKDVPKYLLIGKGYSIDPTDMYLTKEAIRMGLVDSFEEALLAGDYHSGPLSILIPFGVFGAAGFLWVLTAGFRVLYSNYKYGENDLQRINSVLLSYYSAYVVSFFFIFGALSSQLFIFLGTVGLSVSLNHGIKRKPSQTSEQLRRPLGQAYAIELK